MATSITQTDITNLERALVSGELQVRIGDRWITYRSIEELKAQLEFARKEVAKQSDSKASVSAYVGNLDRGI